MAGFRLQRGLGEHQVEVLMRGLDRVVEAVVSAALTETAQELHDMTPVDTQHCRSNWLITTGDHAIPYVVGSREAVSYAGFVVGLAKAARYRLKFDGMAYVTNSVHYLEKLAAGSSPQQPNPGWVGRAIRRAVDRVPQRVARFFT